MARPQAIVIGTSAGGLSALQIILSPLPRYFKLPIMVVQHRAPAAEDFFAFSLGSACRLTIKEAEDKEVVKPGLVYLAPANYHLLVEPDKTLSLSVDAKVCFVRPSIDVLFETAAETYRSGLVGIILTGANNDGTAGMQKIKQRGGLTLAQEPSTAEADLMPRSAVRAGVVDKIMTLPDIAHFLSQLSEGEVE